MEDMSAIPAAQDRSGQQIAEILARKAVSRISPALRDQLYQHYVDGVSWAAIADRYKTTADNVKKGASRALKKAAEAIVAGEPGAAGGAVERWSNGCTICSATCGGEDYSVPDITADDRTVLSGYLLGRLDETEADRVEDRFAGDDVYFNLYLEVERLLVRDYATGTMEPADAALFERNYLVTRERRQQVTIVRALLAVQAERQPAQAARFSPVRKLALAFALAVVAVAAGVYWNQRRPGGSTQIAVLRQVPPGAGKTPLGDRGPDSVQPVAPPRSGGGEASFRAGGQARTGKEFTPDAATETRNNTLSQPAPESPPAQVQIAASPQALPASSSVATPPLGDQGPDPVPPLASPKSGSREASTRAVGQARTGKESTPDGPSETRNNTLSQPAPESSPAQVQIEASSRMLPAPSIGATLEQQLDSQYALTTPTADNTDIVTMGSVLILQKKGLSAGAVANKVPTQNTYKDGQIKSATAAVRKGLGGFSSLSAVPGLGGLAAASGVAGSAAGTAGPARDFVNGEKLYVTKITVDRSKNNGIVFDLISDAYGDAGRYKATLRIELPKGALASGDLAQIQPILAQVFKVAPAEDQSTAAQGKRQPAGAAPAAAIAPRPLPPPDPVVETKSIEVGQTKDQVVATLGQPDKIVKAGSKEIYQYKDLKVTFVNGKMTDVQ
jgi:hypothetical protein